MKYPLSFYEYQFFFLPQQSVSRCTFYQNEANLSISFQIKSTINSYVKIGICIGLLAVLLVMSPILHESLVNCSTAQHPSAQNRTNQTVSPPKKYPIVYDICLDPVDLLQATVALVCGSLLWAISSGTT